MLNASNNPTAQDIFSFVAFLSEALPVVDATTPTEINSGGCGHFAKILYNALSDLGYQPEVVMLAFEERNPFYSRPHGMDWFKDGSNFLQVEKDHIVIGVNGLYLDSTGIMNPKVATCAYHKTCTIEQLQLLLEGDDWNRVFDTDCIPTIERSVNELFNIFKSGKFEFGSLVKRVPRTRTQLTAKTIREQKRQHFVSLNSFLGI